MDTVKAKANEITLDNNSDGIAIVIELESLLHPVRENARESVSIKISIIDVNFFMIVNLLHCYIQ